jgi:hypothetical protein
VSGTIFTGTVSVALSTVTPDSVIRFTLDSSVPETNSQAFSENIVLSRTTIVKARASKTGMADSLVTTATYTLQPVDMPVFLPPSGSSGTNSLELVAACPTAGATIRYTLDGNEPSVDSPIFPDPLTLSQNATVKTKGYKASMAESATATATYAVYAAAPIVIPDPGRTYTNAVTVSLTTSTEGAMIRYTTNGVEPTTSSTLYTNAFVLQQSATVKAKTLKSGMTDSSTISSTYTIIQTVATPMLSPESGTVRTNSVSVTMACATAGATIRYTLDGLDPTITSAAYGSTVNLTQSTTVKAKAFKSGMADSAVISTSYTVIQTVATPVLTPVTGTTFTNSLVITLACATPDAAIRYTLDGSAPTSGSTLYGTTVKVSKNTLIRSRAFKAGMLDSQIVEASYFKMVSLAEAVDLTNTVFTTGGNAIWEGRSLTNAHDSVDAAQSGTITDNQSTWMETTLNGVGTLSFWWKTSCEDDPESDNWDYVRLIIDGAERCRLDGITGWQRITCALGAGAHVIRWEYSKDESLSAGEDRAWVDQLSFTQGTTATTTTPVAVPYAWLDQYPVLLGLAGGDHEAAAWADVDGDGHAAWQEYVTGSVPTNYQSVLRSILTISNNTPWISWSPDLGTARVYSVWGKTNLTEGAWGPINSDSRFYRVRADMP